MDLSGEFTFEHEQQAVWDVLMDPNAIADALPGVEALIPIEGETDAWNAKAKIAVAALSGTYAGSVRMTEKVAPTQYRLTVNGEGQQSIIGGTALITISPVEDDPTKTLLKWDAEANISGKLASIGQRLIAGTANMMSKRFFKGLEKEVARRKEEGETSAE